MKTSQRGINLIKQSEGFRAQMYLDSVGLPTIGYGTLIDTNEEQYLLTTTIDEAKATELLVKYLLISDSELTRLLKKPVNQNQFDALSDFCYNFNTHRLKKSTLLKLINEDPNNKSIRTELMKWHHSGGKDSAGLMRRRNAEANLYFTPYVAPV